MKRCFAFLSLLLLFPLLLTAQEANTLTAKEKAEGWQLLFDGHSTAGWETMKGSAPGATNWAVADGWLECFGKGGGDIITKAKYKSFDVTWEWKLEKGGNSGIKYFVLTERGPIGHEYQLLDDVNHPDGKVPGGKHLTATFYDVLKCQTATPTLAPMEVNRSRILVDGNHVEHWLNGAKVLEYELGSPEVMAAVKESKFKEIEGFGTATSGHILLQNHKSQVWFRNIKLRNLSKSR